MINGRDTFSLRWQLLVKRYLRYPFIVALTIFATALTLSTALSPGLFSGALRLIADDLLVLSWIVLFFYYSDKALFLFLGATRFDRLRFRLRRVLNENPLFIWFIISIILFSLVLILIENLTAMSPREAALIGVADDIVLVIFLVEFYLRYIGAGDDKTKHFTKSETIIDLLALFPLLRIFRVMRFVRLIRFLRIAKLKKYLQTLSESMTYLAALWSENVFNFVIIIMLIFVFLIFGTVAIYHIERLHPAGVRNVPDAFWWSIAMLFVGQPLDINGLGSRLVGAVLIISGIIITSILTGTVAATLSERLSSIKTGNTHYNFRDHVIICGWRSEASEMIGYLQSHMGKKRRHIVVIDDKIDALPPSVGRDVYFVKGSPISESALMRANAPHASAAIIIAEEGRGLMTDQRTVLATLACESLSRASASRDIHTCAELINAENARNLERAYVNEMILIDEHTQDIIAQSAMIPGFIDLVNELLTNERGENNIYKIMSQPFVGRTFGEVYQELSSRNVIPLGVLRQEVCLDGEGIPLVDELGTIEVEYRTFINPDASAFIISSYDRIFVIARPDDILGWEVARE
jgi:voltage-gated potassium channel